MDRPTSTRSTIGLLTLMLLMGLAACEAQGGEGAFSDIALPTFSKDRVAQEAPVEVRRLLSGSEVENLYAMSPSPDGRHFTGIAWFDGGGEVAVVDAETGEKVAITDVHLSTVASRIRGTPGRMGKRLSSDPSVSMART